MSDKGLGPQLVYQNDDFRIESFFDGRPLTIWEMRNPTIMRLVAKAIYEMHHVSGSAERVQEYRPLDKSQLAIDKIINEWGPASLARIAKIKAKLDLNDDGHRSIKQALDLLTDTYLQDGYEDKLRNLVPRDQVCLSHNDVVECNILTDLTENTKVMLIDYEFGMWNPEYYDLANYLNEWCCDNAHPGSDCCIAYYLENWPSLGEIKEMTKHYYML